MSVSRPTRVLFALAAVFGAEPVTAAVHVTGSVKAGTLSAGYQSTDSKGASASLSVDLGRYIRIGLTHEQQITTSEGYENPDGEDTKDIDGDGVKDPQPTYSQQHVYSNSLDLQVVLYEGDLFVPYLLGGIIGKRYVVTARNMVNGTMDNFDITLPPGPNLGAGLGVRLNKDFTLKLQYTVSPGYTMKPGDEKPKSVLDRNMNIGLTYQI